MTHPTLRFTLSHHGKRLLLTVTFIPFCWQAFQVMHELGHLLTAQLTGGEVQRVVVHPLEFSRTDVAPNPRPGLVAWGGPLVGVLLPGLTWALFRLGRWPGEFLVRFLLGFCLVANGAYLGIGSLTPIGDAADLMKMGTPAYLLWLFGALTVPLGFWSWHGLGRWFGWGDSPQPIPDWAPFVSSGLFLALLAATWLGSPR